MIQTARVLIETEKVLAGMITRSIPDLQPAFDEFAACLKARAEH